MLSAWLSGIVPGLIAGGALLVATVFMLGGVKKLPDFAGMSDLQLVLMLGGGSLAFFALIGGPAASAIYEWLRSAVSDAAFVFRAALLTFGILLSVLAFVSRTPLPVEKTVMNLIVSILIAVLVPAMHG